jgi:hypothetical protein
VGPTDAGLAPANAPPDPLKCEDPASGGMLGLEGEEKANSLDCAEGAAPVQPAHDDAKRTATLTAQLALRGIELRRLSSGAFMASSRGVWRRLDDLDEVAVFAVRVGACHA